MPDQSLHQSRRKNRGKTVLVPGVISILKPLNHRLAAPLEGILVFVIFVSRSEIVPRNVQLVCSIFRLHSVDNVARIVRVDVTAVKLKTVHTVRIYQISELFI